MWAKLVLIGVLCVLIGGCVSKPVPSENFPDIAWQNHNGEVDPYLLWTGDTLDISVTTAPELSRDDVIIAPDGRVQMPFIGSVQAAGLTIDDLQQSISSRLSSELRDPRVFVAATAYGSQQIFVSGRVAQPGICLLYTSPSPRDRG